MTEPFLQSVRQTEDTHERTYSSDKILPGECSVSLDCRRLHYLSPAIFSLRRELPLDTSLCSPTIWTNLRVGTLVVQTCNLV